MRRKLDEFIVAFFVPSWIWQRWRPWFYDYEFSEEILPERLSDTESFPGGEAFMVGITHEDMAAVQADLDHLLEVANGNPAVALVMAGYHFDTVIAYITRGDVERVLGHPVSEEEWPAMKEQLSHFDQHVVECRSPLTHQFIISCYDELHRVNNWREHLDFQPWLTVIRARKWKLVGD